MKTTNELSLQNIVSLLALITGLGLAQLSIAETPQNLSNQKISHYLDHKGDRVNRTLDRKGQRIDRRLNAQALKAAANGNIGRAIYLDKKGDRIERKLDRKGNRIDQRLDRKAQRVESRS